MRNLTTRSNIEISLGRLLGIAEGLKEKVEKETTPKVGELIEKEVLKLKELFARVK